MRRMAATILIAVLLVLSLASVALAVEEGPGPAPNSHDGIPDGPGWEVPPPFGTPGGTGPALSGDRLMDGSGL